MFVAASLGSGCGSNGGVDTDGAAETGGNSEGPLSGSSTSGNGSGETTNGTSGSASTSDAQDTSASDGESSGGTGALCGDGNIDADEECDPGDDSTPSCGDALGEGWFGPTACDSDCRNDTSGCEQLAEGAYYVALDGDDSADGSMATPWRTWQHAFDALSPGDTLYIRGGSYTPGTRVRSRVNGASAAWITISGFPGETPVFDCAGIESASCLSIDQSSYVTFRGLTITNFLQQKPTDDLLGGFEITRSNNVRVEKTIVHDIGTACFSSTDNNELYYINSDAYDCVDHLTAELPGNDGTGFVDGTPIVGNTTGHVYYQGCRAWNAGDQGFSSGSSASTHYTNNWSFDNGRLQGGGHGFKMGWVPTPVLNVVNRTYVNNIAFHNRRRGWDTNDQFYENGELLTVNNFAYANGCEDPDDPECAKISHGFYIFNSDSDEAQQLRREYYNNASFDNEDGEVGVGTDGFYTHENNSWDTPHKLSSDDFLSLDTDEMKQPRKPDGSLPDISFGRLAPSSPLVDAGRLVEGIHCDTAGEHPGDTCLEWYGEAPDIGWAEHVE